MMEWRVPMHEILNHWTDEQLHQMFKIRQERLDEAKRKEAGGKMRPYVRPAVAPPPPAYWKKKSKDER